jgi:hypothetical protein
MRLLLVAEVVIVAKDVLRNLLRCGRLNVWRMVRYNDRWTNCCNGRNEAIAALWDGLDDPGGLRVIAEDVSDFRDASDEYVIADEGVVPHGFEQAILGEHLVGVRRQMNQYLHHLGFEMPGLAVPLNRIDLGLD